MSFTRVKPSNWAPGEQLTSAQMNTLDTDHANALDKSAAGDTLLGAVVVGGGSAGRLQANGVGAIAANAFASIGATIAGAIGSAVAGGVVSGVDGGIKLNGSAFDWLGYSTTRAYAYLQMFGSYMDPGNGFTQGGMFLAGNGTGQIAYIPVDRAYEGTVPTKVTLFFAVNNPHSAPPANPPRLGLFLAPMVGAVGFAPSELAYLSTGSGFVVAATGGSGSSWTAGGNMQALVYVPDQTFMIDRASNNYYIKVQDEGGSGALAGTNYYGALIEMGGIATSAPM